MPSVQSYPTLKKNTVSLTVSLNSSRSSVSSFTVSFRSPWPSANINMEKERSLPTDFLPYSSVFVSPEEYCGPRSFRRRIPWSRGRKGRREGRFASNLLFAQSVKAVGTACGFIIPTIGAVCLAADWKVLFPFCALFSLLVWGMLISTRREDPIVGSGFSRSVRIFSVDSYKGYATMLRYSENRKILFGALLFIGAVTSMSSGVPLLLEYRGHDIQQEGMFWAWSIFFFPVLIGRFLGGWILRKTTPPNLMVWSMWLALIGVVFIFIHNDMSIYIGSICVGFGFANIFPILFAVLLERNPDKEDLCSGLMMSTIVGGAIFPLIWGILADLISVAFAFTVPAVSILYLLWLGLWVRRSG